MARHSSDLNDYPTESERKQDRNEWLQNQGCDICGEDNPNQLQEVSIKLPPVGRQSEPPSGPVACDDHIEDVKEKYQCCLRPDYEVSEEEIESDYGDYVEVATCSNCGEEFKSRPQKR